MADKIKQYKIISIILLVLAIICHISIRFNFAVLINILLWIIPLILIVIYILSGKGEKVLPKVSVFMLSLWGVATVIYELLFFLRYDYITMDIMYIVCSACFFIIFIEMIKRNKKISPKACIIALVLSLLLIIALHIYVGVKYSYMIRYFLSIDWIRARFAPVLLLLAMYFITKYDLLPFSEDKSRTRAEYFTNELRKLKRKYDNYEFSDEEYMKKKMDIINRI